jgi:G:T-mismatch repair DNA endonuclease (very short patch repair protein)
MESNLQALRKAGWRVLTVWECQTLPKQRAKLAARLTRFLAG